jgi:hypothetical protein
MAKLIGSVKLTGSIGDLTFANTKNGCIVRMKSSLMPNQVKTSPAFIRTRETCQEFGHAAKGGKLIREAFGTLIKGIGGAMSRNLHAAVHSCIKEDPINTRGQRTVTDGALPLLTGFDFNSAVRLQHIFYAPLNFEVARTTGTMEIIIPSFIPAISLNAPADATHYKLIAAGAAINFQEGTYTSNTSESPYLPITHLPTAALSLTVSVTPNTTLPLFQVFAIHFYKEVNGVYYSLNNTSKAPVSIVNIIPALPETTE